MSNDERKMSILIDSDHQTRKGCLVDFAMATTKGPNTRIDFISTDIPDDDGGMRGVLSARVHMTNENLIALRDMLNAHTKNWEVTVDDGRE